MDQVKDRLAALVPYYDGQGANGTGIYTTGGEIISDKRTVKWNLQRLARRCNIDLQAARRNYGRYLGCRQGIPLPFSATLVLIPLRSRKPIGKNDGSYSYINALAVEGVQRDREEGGKGCVITLTGGHRLISMYALSTVQKKLRQGKIAYDYYRREQNLEGAGSLLPVWMSPSWWKLLENLVKTIIQETTDSSPAE